MSGGVADRIEARHRLDAIDLGMARIDQMDRPRKAGIAQVAQCDAPERVLARAGADHRDRFRRHRRPRDDRCSLDYVTPQIRRPALIALEASGENYDNSCRAFPGQEVLAMTDVNARLQALDRAQALVRELDGTITYWSSGMVRMYGFSAAEATRRSVHELLKTEFSSSLSEIEIPSS